MCRRRGLRATVLYLVLPAFLSCRSTASAPDPSQKAEPAGAMVEAKAAIIMFSPALGALEENIRELTSVVAEVLEEGARLVLTPELATTGYAISRAQVHSGLGLRAPFPELRGIRELATRYRAYVYVGIAELASEPDGDHYYNSVVLFGPNDTMSVSRKRSDIMGHDSGNLPFDIVSTPFGEIGALICADMYPMDWVRILTLKGADVIVTPVNWWGENGQLRTWQGRAKENGVWVLAANRWGQELDSRFDPPRLLEMNDGPSAVVAPDGMLRALFRAEHGRRGDSQILYTYIQVPAARIGAGRNTTYTVASRRPSAYTQLASSNYRPDLDDPHPPGLPPAGSAEVAALAYQPEADPRANVATIIRLLDSRAGTPDVLALPGLGISAAPVALDSPEWQQQAPWKDFFDLVETRGIDLAVTTILVQPERDAAPRIAALAARSGQAPQVLPQVHDAWGMPGTGEPPGYVDLAHLRVAVLTGADSLFPELGTHLAKLGVDLLLVSSTVGAAGIRAGVVPRPADGPADWTLEDLLRAWTVRTNDCFDLVGVDASGNGLVVEQSYCMPVKQMTIDRHIPAWSGTLDSSHRRRRSLNTLQPFDLYTLLGRVSPPDALRAPPIPRESR